MEEQAQLQHAAAREMHTDQRNRLTAELQARHAELENARRGLALSLRLSELTRKTLDVMLVEYSAGDAGIDEVLTVERELLRHALDRENMRAEINRAYDELRYLTAQEKDGIHE
jgi:outer membrane protein TolC